MAIVYQLDDLLTNNTLQSEWGAAMHAGAICMYPTDTVYGIGMIMTIDDAIHTINTVRKSPVDKKVSCIVPSFDWLYERYDDVSRGVLEEYASVHGSMTLIMDETSPGWRVIDHPMQQVVALLGVPLISSSANCSGDAPATTVDTIPIDLLDDVDIIVDGGRCDRPPSTLIDVQHDCVIPRISKR